MLLNMVSSPNWILQMVSFTSESIEIAMLNSGFLLTYFLVSLSVHTPGSHRRYTTSLSFSDLPKMAVKHVRRIGKVTKDFMPIVTGRWEMFCIAQDKTYASSTVPGEKNLHCKGRWKWDQCSRSSGQVRPKSNTSIYSSEYKN